MQLHVGGALLFGPLTCFFILRNYHLNQQQLKLLFLTLLLSVSLLLNNWLTYLTYLLLMGWESVLLLAISKETNLFDKDNQQKQSNFKLWFFQVSEQDVMVVVYVVLLWIGIKVGTTRSLQYEFQHQGRVGTFVQVLKGWNCTFFQFTFINLVWLLFLILSYWAAAYLIRTETTRSTLYKQYVLRYKITPNLFISLIITTYNYWAYMHSESLSTCSQYYHSGELFRIVWFWGYPCTTLYFFYIKNGVFLMKDNNTEKADQEELEDRINKEAIDRQLSIVSERDRQLSIVSERDRQLSIVSERQRQLSIVSERDRQPNENNRQ